MHKILIVDDDEATLKLMRIRLSEAYEAICTRDPEQVLGLALEHKPDAILLDRSRKSPSKRALPER